MKIAVCIKQVPGNSDGIMDSEKGVLIRAGIKSVMNVYDKPAIETAMRIKEKLNATVDVFTMGPFTAKQVLIDAYEMGVDNAYLISDRCFSCADVLATSYTLSQALQAAGGYDLIICGKQTTDGDTGQVGSSIAEHLSIPHVSWVSAIDQMDCSTITVEQNLSDITVKIQLLYPCLITVERGIFTPRMPSLKLKIAAKKKSVQIMQLENMIDKDESHYGLNGSATRVEKIFSPIKTIQQKILIDNEGDSSNMIAEVLRGLK